MPKPKETERHVLVSAIVVEVPKGTDVEDMGNLGVVQNLVCWLDGVLRDEEARNEDGTLFYCVRDVTLFSEKAFVAEMDDHGAVGNFPDVKA